MSFTLRDRLALVNVLVLLLALLILSAIVLKELVDGLYQQLDQGLAILSYHELVRVEIESGRPFFETRTAQPVGQLGSEGFIRLLDHNGQIIDGFGAYRTTPVLKKTLAATQRGLSFNQTSAGGQPMRVYTLPIMVDHRVIGYLQVADDREDVQETIGWVRQSLIIGTPLAVLISGLVSFFAARQALRPLTAMTHSAATITADALTERLPVSEAADEVHELALAFNATLDRLEAAFKRQRRFTADASHELRTPVTAILGQAELALSRPRTPESYWETLTRIQQEAERMQRLIGQMLALARTEAGYRTVTAGPVDLVRLIQSLVETLQPYAAEKGLRLEVVLPSALTLITDSDSLTQILLNLLENAIAYSDQGQIRLTLTADSDWVHFKVEDTGQGIAAEHLPYIFDPFYRTDPARTSSRGSVGLGLALTKDLVHLLGGTIDVTSRPTVGTTFTVILPQQFPRLKQSPTVADS